VADWVLDEQPLKLTTKTGTMYSVPYTVEVNDVVMSAVQQQPSDEIWRRGRDTFDRLLLDGATAPRIMAISIHPYLTGVPHRIKYLESSTTTSSATRTWLMWTGEENPRLVQGPNRAARPPRALPGPGAGRRSSGATLSSVEDDLDS